jgi:alkylation response protein AidB-like acyl-CoA dehydrogenase
VLLAPSADHAVFSDSIARVLADRYDTPRRAALTRSVDGFSRENWSVFAELGWLGALFDEAAGGFGDGVNETILLFEKIGASLVVEPLLDCAMLAGQVLSRVGADIAAEEIAAVACGSRRIVLLASVQDDTAPVQLRPDVGGSWRLTGQLSVVRWAPAADAFLVHAAMEDGESALLLIASDLEGIIRTDLRLVDGARASDVRLNDIAVPAPALLAKGASVREALSDARDLATLAICAEALGAMDRCVWITRDYLQTRRQFGQFLGGFQALQHRLADMVIELELARAMLRRCASVLLNGPPRERRRAASACKVTISKAGAFIAANAIQLHGGIGVTDEYVIGHYFKRLMVIETQFGDRAHHLRRFAES